MFKHIKGHPGGALRFYFNGQAISAREGDSIAAALLAAGITNCRQTPRNEVDRGPFCLMGACYDCLVEIDGKTLQGCMTIATEGLEVFSPARASKFETQGEDASPALAPPNFPQEPSALKNAGGKDAA